MGVFDCAEALDAQHEERAALETRRRAKRRDDAEVSARVAARIRSRYQEHLATSQNGGQPSRRGYVPAFPWQED
jgi:hypothetical protein